MSRTKGRANGEGSPHQDKHGVWWAQLTINGKKVRRRAASQAEAREKLRQLHQQQQAGVNLRAQQPTLTAWCATWLAAFAPDLKGHIKEDYAGIVRRYIADAPIGRRRLNALTPAEVQAWLNGLTAQGLAPRTVRNAHARLRRALAVAVEQGYISRNVASSTKRPKARTVEMHFLDFTQAGQLLATVADHRWYALYRLALNTGMRLSELTGLTWDGFNAAAGTLTVKQQLKRTGKAFILATVKTDASERTLTLDSDLVAELRAHKASQAEERVLLGSAWGDPWVKERGGLLFVSDSGSPLHNSMVYRHFKAALKRAGLPSAVRFHDLRHTAATLMLMDHVPLVTVSKVLGHSSPSITAAIYAHALDDSKAGAIAGLSARLKRAQ